MQKLDENSEKAERLQLVTTKDWIKKVHAWRAQQPEPPSLSAAIRQLVEERLDGTKKTKARKTKVA